MSASVSIGRGKLRDGAETNLLLDPVSPRIDGTNSSKLANVLIRDPIDPHPQRNRDTSLRIFVSWVRFAKRCHFRQWTRV
jgi:hypothetical protein